MMGCCYSRLQREEMVARCKSRKRYMKQFVKSRTFLSNSHSLYLKSLRSTGSALFRFANYENALHHNHRNVSPPPKSQSPPPPAMPSPPSPEEQKSWNFWDPFASSSARYVAEEEWGSEMAAVNTDTCRDSAVDGDEKSELAMEVAKNGKEMGEIVKEIDDYFQLAADAGKHVSLLLEVTIFSNQNASGKVYNCGRSLSPLNWRCVASTNSKLNDFGKMYEEVVAIDDRASSDGHRSTAEKLYAWEKKLYREVKNADTTKKEHDKKVAQLKKMLEMKRRSDYEKTDKLKKEVEKLESILKVAAQSIESVSDEIIKVRESELYPQLIELVKGFMCMWKNMHEIHKLQMEISQQLKQLNSVPSSHPTSDTHHQSTILLQSEIQQWQQSFHNTIKSQRDYIQSLSGWLRLSLFQFNQNILSKTTQESQIYLLCEEWHMLIDQVPDKTASEGINDFLTVINSIVFQQAEEHKQKKKSITAFKELEKKTAELRVLEDKYGPNSKPEHSSTRNRSFVAEKQAKVKMLHAKAEEEKEKHEKSIGATRTMTLNSFQTGFPHVFEAVMVFSSECARVFNSVYDQVKSTDELQDMKMTPTLS